MKTIPAIILSITVPAALAFATPVVWANKEEAGKHFEKGVELFNNEDFSAALIEFEAAYDAHPHFAVRYNIAMCFYKLKEYGSAVHQIQRYLAEGGEEVPKKKKVEVEKILEDLQSLVASVKINCNVEGAEVYVNGEYRDKVPMFFPIQLDVGKYEIEIRAEGYEPYKHTVKLPGRAAETIDVELVPAGQVPTGGESSSKEAIQPTSKKRVPVAAFGAMAGLTGALALTASIMGGMALKKEKDYEGLGVDDAWEDAQKSGRNLVIATDVLWGITGAAAVTTVILVFFTDFKRGETTEAAWVIAPDLVNPGLTLKGVF